jgi:beta-lactamase regulating signal transducer with metallopeptidase domain/uncharacterized membrane protein YkoI
MEKISQVLLTFLLNACWQAALITAVAALCAWLLRESPARHKHLLWVATLACCFCLPVWTCVRQSGGIDFTSPPPTPAPQQITGSAHIPLAAQPTLEESDSAIPISSQLAAGLLALYGLSLLYRSLRLFTAWRRTRAIARGASAAELLEPARAVIETCKASLGVTRVRLHGSPTVTVPMTVGTLDPLVILPEPLLREAQADVLTAAFGHELVHVLRRDYALNLFYELLYLLLSFHPAVALVRRRIQQTREMCCDAVVAQRLLNVQTYARSLVHLASSALPLRQRVETLTVGIADADILEVRIMSLLKKTRSSVRRNKWLLAAACVLLILPCLTAATFAFQFQINPQPLGLIAQVPWPEVQENQEKAAREAKRRAERDREEREIKERAEHDPQLQAELIERERREKIEREVKAKQQVELVRLARVTMDQAIQTATAESPGKVLECGLIGGSWEAPGKLAKDGKVLYHVVILSGDEATPIATHVWVSAIDGSIIRVEKEGR